MADNENGQPRFEDDSVFLSDSSLLLDDAAILAQCERPNENNVEPKVPPCGILEDGRPHMSLGLEGSTININNSSDIHFGAKTISSESMISNPSSHLNQSFLNSSNCSNIPSPDTMSCSTFPSFNSQSVHSTLPINTPKSNSRNSSTNELPHSYDSSNHQLIDSSQYINSPVDMYGRTFQWEEESNSTTGSNMKLTMGSIGNVSPSSGFPGMQNLVQRLPEEMQRLPQEMQRLPQDNFIKGPLQQSPMSAAISNSSHVQMGTQIVYNYYITDPEQRSPRSSTSSFSDLTTNFLQNSQQDFLVDFREKLITGYKKRTRSSPLPWHRGKQLIPISEYYTEPQIFAIDKCGKRTTEAVHLIPVLSSGRETRYLLEGEAGMGKTFLATKLAEEWANGQQLQQFQILLFITLGDFKVSLQQYVKDELLPSYFKAEQFEQVWEYCKSHEREVLFILDGYDELEKVDKIEIENLIRSKDFPGSKVIVTSRPNFLQEWDKKIVVSGFGQFQIMNFIDKYFTAIGNKKCGHSLRKIIEKDEKYWKLARRPLFCVLLCMLYITGEVDQSLPERQSDVMLQIILCLIKWNRKNNENPSIDFDSLPQEYEKPFTNFGKLCLTALRTEKSRFSQQEVSQVDGFETKLEQLGFLYNDNESHALGEKKFWKPIHQTFLEYLGAFYMSKHIKDCKSCKECKDYNLIFQRSQEVLKFCVGILNNKAYKVLDGQRFPFLWMLPVVKILQLLKEAEPKAENCQAVAKLLDHSIVEITTSEAEFEGWSILLNQAFKNLVTLRIVWRIKSKSPDQESSFIEANESQYKSFFEALKNNDSIKNIHVRAKQDGEPFSDEKMAFFFKFLETGLYKKNLQELHLEMKMNASSHLKIAIENIARLPSKKAFYDLKSLKLHTFMVDEDLDKICEALTTCAPTLESLHFEGLEHGHSGFQSLARLLKSNSCIKSLHLSMNQSLFVNPFGGYEENDQNYAPEKMRGEHQRMNRTAGRRSRSAFSQHEMANLMDQVDISEENWTEASMIKNGRNYKEAKDIPGHDPKKELAFLFEKLPLTSSLWTLEARRFWFLRKVSSDIRIPLPLCVHREHKSVFHLLFSELPATHIKTLSLSQAGLYLTIFDMMCLGSAIRASPHLASLNLQGLDKAECYLPLLIALGQSSSMSNINFSSSKVVIKESTFAVLCAALEGNSSLRNVSLRRWQFHLQDSKESMTQLAKVLSSWSVSQLDLKQCLVEFGNSAGSYHPQSPKGSCSQPLNAFFALPFEDKSAVWKSLKTLSLEGVEVKEETGLVRRGHLLLAGIINFSNLISLDLSTFHSRSIQVDNISLRRLFGLIGSEMKHLVELKLDSWEFNLDSKDSEFSQRLHSCKKLKKVQLERVNEIIPQLNKNGITISPWCKMTFLHHLISHMPNLEEVSLCYYKINNYSLDVDTALGLSQCLHNHWHHTPFSVKFSNLSADVDHVIYQTLKKHPCRVKKVSGPSLIRTFEVKSVLDIIKRH